MASIKLTPGTLNPPACYASEQERFQAYVSKIVASILGGLQWESSSTVPVDLALYWLRRNADSRPRGPRSYSAVDGRWIPWLEVPVMPDSSGGAANAYTVTTGHNMVSNSIRLTGRKVLFIAAATNTGASTLDVDGTGAVEIVRHDAEDLAPGDIVSGMIYEVVFNAGGGGWWELTTPVPPPASTTPTFESLSASAPPAIGASLDLVNPRTDVPDVVDVRLVCTAADRGYAIGDELPISSFFFSVEGSGSPAYAVAVNATHVSLVRSSSVTRVLVAPKGGGSMLDVAVDTTKWSVRANLIFFP